jgi:hypothetical protein
MSPRTSGTTPTVRIASCESGGSCESPRRPGRRVRAAELGDDREARRSPEVLHETEKFFLAPAVLEDEVV